MNLSIDAGSQFLWMNFSSAFNETVFMIPNWKWVILASLFAFGIILQELLSRFFEYLKQRSGILKNLHPWLRYFLETEINGSLAWLVIVGLWMVSLEILEIHGNLGKYLFILNQVILSFYLIRIAYLGVEAFGRFLGDFVQTTPGTLDDQLAPLIAKSMKVLVVLLGILMTMQNFGINVMGILAGLGIGGLALALAAKDTASNLFGSITIILDRPFQIGDWIKVGEIEGTVEELGFRSTRIRTFYKSLVTIPNAVLANEKIDNLGLRPCRRIRHIIAVTKTNDLNKLQQFCEQLRYFLVQIPSTQKDNASVQLTKISDLSLEVTMTTFIDLQDSKEESRIQEEILFEILRLANSLQVELANSHLALVTR